MRGRILAAAAVLLAALGPLTPAQESPAPRTWHLGASASWEYLRSDSTSQGTSALFTSLQQKYSLDLLGTIWDPRFSRFQVGLDLFETDRERDGVSLDSSNWGYRAALTLFPNRPFPLRLHARRSVTDVSGLALADSDRETASWGADWLLTVGSAQRLRLSYERSGFDLVSPVALAERRRTGVAEYRYTWKRSELTARYNHNDQKELFQGSRFRRDGIAMTQRTRFSSGATWLANLDHTSSDATFSTGTRDQLTIDRLTTVVDLPRRRRVGWTFGYEYNGTDGRFVTSRSHNLRVGSRILAGRSWEILSGASAGTIDTNTATGRSRQDLMGLQTGARFHKDWQRFALSWTGTVGYNRSDFGDGTRRELLARSVQLDLRRPLRRGAELFGSLSTRRDETDVIGVGFSVDESTASFGIEGQVSTHLRGRVAASLRDVSRDTFDYGRQDARTYRLESTLNGQRMALTLTLASTDGVSDFIPDPGQGSPFTPGPDLVNASDSAIVGLRWRLASRLRLRLEGRYERRHFSSIGLERIVTFHPQLDWVFRVWTVSLGYSHYQRDNTTRFADDTLLFRVGRKLF